MTLTVRHVLVASVNIQDSYGLVFIAVAMQEIAVPLSLVARLLIQLHSGLWWSGSAIYTKN
jgi:hypothetical protein